MHAETRLRNHGIRLVVARHFHRLHKFKVGSMRVASVWATRARKSRQWSGVSSRLSMHSQAETRSCMAMLQKLAPLIQEVVPLSPKIVSLFKNLYHFSQKLFHFWQTGTSYIIFVLSPMRYGYRPIGDRKFFALAGIWKETRCMSPTGYGTMVTDEYTRTTFLLAETQTWKGTAVAANRSCCCKPKSCCCKQKVVANLKSCVKTFPGSNLYLYFSNHCLYFNSRSLYFSNRYLYFSRFLYFSDGPKKPP